VVKAGALGDAHVKSWDRTWSNPGFEKAHRVGLVLKLRPLVTVAGVSQILVFFPFLNFNHGNGRIEFLDPSITNTTFSCFSGYYT